ncbi:hypothetical protein U472_13275 [Orenia metallireducens]|uniref:Uncharacterized protein n=1 Tax=Orenia metallireducens TaxID=1413210 RepID=A0A1C0A5C9_9FIRM|nr:hypothetical protein [Orenia metallireducens]OCL25323.1 hypothetical protein U472_13275 [Orenia metallireducens]
MNNQRNKRIQILITAAVVFLVPTIAGYLMSTFSKHNVEDVRAKIEDYLYKKYGEEFVVDRIGTRTSSGQKYYEARIYPKSIIGTNKAGDSYYYASASTDKLSFGRLGGVGDSYSYVNRNIDMEKYLMPKVKEVFGERVLLKVDVAHEVTTDGSWWAGYKSASLEQMNNKIKNDPEHNRMLLELYIYIFDRIDNKTEKEERRQEIFEYVQYLKKEGLFKYLELGVIFIDERVLAPSYREFDREIFLSDKVREVIKGERVYLPPIELRRRMSKELQKEVAQMSEEKLLANIRKIRKSELSYKGIRKENSSYNCWIYSKGILKEKYTTTYETKPELIKNYNKISDIVLGRNLEYIYVN